MIADFYDIESLSNAFTICNYQPYNNHLEVYILCDDKSLFQVPAALYTGPPGQLPTFEQLATAKIHEANKNFTGTVSFYYLDDPQNIARLARTFGVSTANPINDPDLPDTYNNMFRIVCDTDPGYSDETHPYYMGYNSYNYDTTMLAIFFEKSLISSRYQDPNDRQWKNRVGIIIPTAKEMHEANNDLFSDAYKNNMPDYLSKKGTRGKDGVITPGKPNFSNTGWKIRKNMLMSGRHVDVARLNDKASKVALKRLLGMLGGQILESNKLAHGQMTLYSFEELIDLIAYNASDVINLKLVLFDHPVYQGQFSLKKKLLADYPELVYDREDSRHYAPVINPKKVRRDRLFIDSSSAQLATKALCPYDHLTDIPVVSYMYPSERKAKELGVPRVNVLEECKKFFYARFPQPEVRAEFDKIYNFYKSIEGKNFNQSKNYREDYGQDYGSGEYELPGPDPKHPEWPFGLNPFDSRTIPKTDTCMCYYGPDGKPSRGFITFSIGGIHGAEYNKDMYEYDVYKYQVEQYLMQQVQTQYPNPIDLKAAKHVTVKVPDENGNVTDVKFPAGKFLKSGATLKKAEYRVLDKMPTLFKVKDGATSLNPSYVYTSSDPTNHEDFTSYYPNMLRMLSAFYNEGLGYDRYAEIFDQKQDLGVLMKGKNSDYAKLCEKTSPEIIPRYDKLRENSGCQLEPGTISDDERAVYAVQREGTKLILNSASGAADAGFESNIRMNNVIISMRAIG